MTLFLISKYANNPAILRAVCVSRKHASQFATERAGVGFLAGTTTEVRFELLLSSGSGTAVDKHGNLVQLAGDNADEAWVVQRDETAFLDTCAGNLLEIVIQEPSDSLAGIALPVFLAQSAEMKAWEYDILVEVFTRSLYDLPDVRAAVDLPRDEELRREAQVTPLHAGLWLPIELQSGEQGAIRLLTTTNEVHWRASLHLLSVKAPWLDRCHEIRRRCEWQRWDNKQKRFEKVQQTESVIGRITEIIDH